MTIKKKAKKLFDKYYRHPLTPEMDQYEKSRAAELAIKEAYDEYWKLQVALHNLAD